MTPDLGPTNGRLLDVVTSTEVYQAAVVRLTAELATTRERLAESRRVHKDEVQALQAQLREGLTPEILQLRRSVSAWRGRAQAAEARLREARRGGADGTR